MSCCIPKKSKAPLNQPQEMFPENNNNVRHEVLLRLPSCKVHLFDEGEAIELATGEFELSRVTDENVSLATAIKIGNELQWPLTKDEPVVKLSPLQYIFSLPMKDDKPLSYGVTFSSKNAGNLGLLDTFLKEHSLFSATSSKRQEFINWKVFAPAVDDYNSVLAMAIANGSGQIVKGIFKCSNAYVNKVQKGGVTILIRAAEVKDRTLTDETSLNINNNSANKKSNSTAVNKSLKRVRKLSKMTEKMSKAMLDVVGIASGSVIGPVVRSQAGKSFLAMVPGEVLLASLDAVNKILDAAEAAEKQTMAATSGAVIRMVTNKYGENAGEATEDALATAGHVAGTAWNVIKIRKAINPASSVSSGVVKNAGAIKNAVKSPKL